MTLGTSQRWTPSGYSEAIQDFSLPTLPAWEGFLMSSRSFLLSSSNIAFSSWCGNIP